LHYRRGRRLIHDVAVIFGERACLVLLFLTVGMHRVLGSHNLYRCWGGEYGTGLGQGVTREAVAAGHIPYTIHHLTIRLVALQQGEISVGVCELADRAEGIGEVVGLGLVRNEINYLYLIISLGIYISMDWLPFLPVIPN
jgi:hypothetical protein